MIRFSVVPYNPLWPAQFQAIKADLAADFDYYSAQYHSIEHIGSTSVPGLVAKDCIDIVIVIDDPSHFAPISYALCMRSEPSFQPPYTCVGNGGVKGRLSFKMPEAIPGRHVCVVLKDSVNYKSHIALRETLTRDAELREKYAEVKLRLAEQDWEDLSSYGPAKDSVVREILRGAGWNEGEIAEKEGLYVNNWLGPWMP